MIEKYIIINRNNDDDDNFIITLALKRKTSCKLNCFILFLQDYLKLKSKSRLSIPKFSNSHFLPNVLKETEQ